MNRRVDTERGAYWLTAHAQARAQQRGVREAAIATVIERADNRRHVPGGLVACAISRRRLAARRCAMAPELAERCSGLVVLVDPATHTVVTVMHGTSGRARPYRSSSPR